MAVNEANRRAVHESLERAHGTDVADLIMQMLPYQINDELVTRSDLHATTIMLRGEMAELRGELRGDMAELRADVRTQIASLNLRIAGLIAANAVALIGALVT